MQPKPKPNSPPVRIRATDQEGIYQVSSDTDPRLMHTVDINHASRPTCSCEAGRNGFKHCTIKPFCWHVRFAINYRLWQRDQRANHYQQRRSQAAAV
jgi:hypothetical protein